MAKRRVNKTAAVREYFDEHPDAGPTEVVNALKQKRIKVTANYVSNIKSKSGGKQVKRRRGRPKASSVTANGSLSGKLAEAIQLVEKVGGIDKAKETLDAVKALEKS